MENLAAAAIGFFLGIFICVNVLIYEQWKNKLK